MQVLACVCCPWDSRNLPVLDRMATHFLDSSVDVFQPYLAQIEQTLGLNSPWRALYSVIHSLA
jgi:hypothetical protein